MFNQKIEKELKKWKEKPAPPLFTHKSPQKKRSAPQPLAQTPIQIVNSIDNLYKNAMLLSMFIPREAEKVLKDFSQGYPVLAITGPRQSGKTTLAKEVFPQKPYVSLEDPDVYAFAQDDPRDFLASFPEGAIIDEAQNLPEIFSYLQTLVDEKNRMGLYVLTGSQQFGLLENLTQSLAGRLGLVELLPFSLREISGFIQKTSLEKLLLKGLYPPLYSRQLVPGKWHANYVSTYIERDVRKIINIKDLNAFRRFIRMCAARTGQLLNLSSLANDCGITHNTASAWISILEASYIIFRLEPYHKNFGKRLVKMPKLYFYDSGLAAWLLNIQDEKQMSIHPQKGALFEGFVIAEMLKRRLNNGLSKNLYFWRNNLGVEIDLIIENSTNVLPVEIKAGKTVNDDFFINLKKWQTYSGDENKSLVIYGGDKKQKRGNKEVFPWIELTKPFMETD